MIKFWLALLFVVIGAVLGIGIKSYYPTLPVEDKINLIDLATLLATVFLAVYIPIFLEKNLHSKRHEKDIIIRKIEQLQNTIKEVNKVVTECVQKGNVSAINSHTIINHFTIISNELDTLITLIEYCQKNKFKSEIEKIKGLRHQYKTIVTGGNFQRKNFKYSALTKKEEEITYQKMDKELCLLIFKVNKV